MLSEKIYQLLELVRELKVSPLLMKDIANHTGKNLAAFGVLTLLMSFSVTIFAGGVSLSLFGAALVAFIASVTVGVIGLFANLVLPVPVDENGNEHEKDTNKFVTYAITSFLFTIGVFVILGLLFLLFGRKVQSPVDWLTVYLLWDYNTATLVVSLGCSIIGTLLLYGLLYHGNRILATGASLVSYILATVGICAAVFYVSHFVLLS